MTDTRHILDRTRREHRLRMLERAASDTTRLDALEAADVTHDSRLDALEAGGGDDLEPRVAALEADVVTLEGVDAALDARVDALEAADVALDGRLDTAEADIAALEGADVALDGRLDTLETFTANDRYLPTGVFGTTDGSAIPAGKIIYVRASRSGTIAGWEVVADAVGSIVIDVWKDTYANFPPTVADTIAGSEKPTLSAAQKAQDASLTTWSTSVTAGDWFAFKVDSASVVSWVAVTLVVVPT